MMEADANYRSSEIKSRGHLPWTRPSERGIVLSDLFPRPTNGGGRREGVSFHAQQQRQASPSTSMPAAISAFDHHIIKRGRRSRCSAANMSKTTRRLLASRHDPLSFLSSCSSHQTAHAPYTVTPLLLPSFNPPATTRAPCIPQVRTITSFPSTANPYAPPRVAGFVTSASHHYDAVRLLRRLA